MSVRSKVQGNDGLAIGQECKPLAYPDRVPPAAEAVGGIWRPRVPIPRNPSFGSSPWIWASHRRFDRNEAGIASGNKGGTLRDASR